LKNKIPVNPEYPANPSDKVVSVRAREKRRRKGKQNPAKVYSPRCGADSLHIKEDDI